jgi:hypothetical protein
MLQQSNRLRCAFTIAEMLTVLAIIVLLMTLVLGAVSYVGTWQMKRQTEQTMVKALGHLDRWIEKIRNNVEHPLGTSWYKTNIRDVAANYAGSDASKAQRQKVLEFKLLYKYRTPMSYAELNSVPQGDPDIDALKNYLRPPSPRDQSSVCLAIILQHISAPGEFSEKELVLQDTYNDGRVGLLDAWRNPIRFYRYGYLAPTIYQQVGVNEIFSSYGKKDPDDPNALLSAPWWTFLTTNGLATSYLQEFAYGPWAKFPYNPAPPYGAPYGSPYQNNGQNLQGYLPLLLVSAGPDGVFGTSDDILSYTLRPVAGGR